ncbi:MAG: nucleoside monophosphate kinase [Caldimicrobium sp.]|nr:nucleoside monophosphate kinase [Caldimicrobium sp.]
MIRSILLLGPTGSGKSPLGTELEKRGILGKRVLHFDFGENLRKAAQGALHLSNEDKLLINNILKEARLLKPEEFYLAQNILYSFLHHKHFDEADILVLNGLPRNLFQATELESKIKVILVINLTIDVKSLIIRLATDPAGDRIHREDDKLEYVRKKLKWFKKETLPLIEFYRERGANLVELPVEVYDNGFSLYQKLLTLLPRECI